jgi:hypothetical protein
MEGKGDDGNGNGDGEDGDHGPVDLAEQLDEKVGALAKGNMQLFRLRTELKEKFVAGGEAGKFVLGPLDGIVQPMSEAFTGALCMAMAADAPGSVQDKLLKVTSCLLIMNIITAIIKDYLCQSEQEIVKRSKWCMSQEQLKDFIKRYVTAPPHR